MQAVILVGGLGTRLRPLTYAVPKPLLPILGKAMVDHIIGLLPPRVDLLVLAVSYKSSELEAHIRESDRALEVKIVVEDDPLGTGGAVKNVEKHLDGTFLVFNGDVICSLDTASMVDFHEKNGGIGSISLWPADDPSRFGVVDLDQGQRILKFIEKPKKEEAPSNLINAGTYVLEPEILDYMEAGKKISIEREVFPRVIDKGLYGYQFHGYWVDAGTRVSFLDAHRVLMDHGAAGVGGKPSLGKGARLDGHVHAGEGCSIGEGTVVGPYVTLGNSVGIGRDCEIMGSILLSGVKLGNGCKVRNSIVGPGSTLGKNVMLENVIVAADQVVEDSTSEHGNNIG